MTDKKIYRLHVDGFLRLTELFGEYSSKNDLFIELPYSDELDDAVCLINALCSDKLERIKKQEFDDFIASQFAKIKQFIESGEKDSLKAKRLMAETASFYKDKKNDID